MKATATLKFKENILKWDNAAFYLIDKDSYARPEQLIDYDAIIMDASDQEYTRLLLRRFRAHHNSSLYLKPIYLVNYKEQADVFINELIDGIIYFPEQITEKINEISELKQRITHLDTDPGHTFESQLIKKVLAFLYTREKKSIKPLPYVYSSIGYTYPVLSVNFESFEEFRVLDILSWAENENIIWPDFVDRVYFCNNCKNGHLVYREICPSCDSANIKSQDLIHHFPCGYIGPVSDFRNTIDSTMNCPKCSKNLRHIGVDYDKPSIINHCQNCNEVFQDYIVKAKCIHCKHDTDVQYLLAKDINAYKLTKKGRHAATSGFIGERNEKEDEIFGAVNQKTFQTMLYYETERVKHNMSANIQLCGLQLENIFDLTRKFGKSKEKAFLTELVQIIREQIKTMDFINITNPSMILICMADSSPETANELMQRISDKIKELIANNFNGFSIVTEFKTESLKKDIPFEKQIHNLSTFLVQSND